MRQTAIDAGCKGLQIGFVPTMGYLHEGHLALARRARADNDLLIMSIFVNPTQFGPGEDFERYPRDLERDSHLAVEVGVDIVFLPSTDTMYPRGPAGQRVWVEPRELASYLCGASRPGHFAGVATVVMKLLNMTQPDRAYFGQKDAQQAIIVRSMVEDLALPVEIVVLPTVREGDGLALSSRNVYLSPIERSQASVLHRSLEYAREALGSGERDSGVIEASMRRLIAEAAPLARIDYVEIADLDTLHPVQGRIERDVLVALAVYFGRTRLIDNMMVRFEGEAPGFT